MEYLNSIFHKAIFIHVIRDPRAVVASLLNAGFWEEGGGLTKPWWANGLIQEDLDNVKECGWSSEALAAVQWRRIVVSAEEERKRLEDVRYVEVRYEDFVKRPHSTLSKVFGATGIDDSPRAHCYLDSVGRLKNMNYKFSERLSRKQIETVQRLTYSISVHKGYFFRHEDYLGQ